MATAGDPTPRVTTRSGDDAAGVRRNARLTAFAMVLALGLALTSVLTWVVRSNYQSTESRLLRLQTAQAAEVLSVAASSTAQRFASTQLAELDHGGTSVFQSTFGPLVHAGTYADASLWSDQRGGLRELTSIGPRPLVALSSPAGMAMLRRSVAARTFAVQILVDHRARRLVYVAASPGSTYVIFAENRLPKPKHSKLKSNAAFSQLGFAIYIGRGTGRALVSTAGPAITPDDLTSTQSVPFGTSFLTVVATPAESLAGNLPAELPWIVGIAGGLLALLAALAAQALVARQQVAQRDALQSRRLSEDLARAYAEQRGIAETLQRSLLPVRNPAIPGIAVATRYVAGARATEVGGDWYSIVALDGDDRFGFVVGDVAGRGIQAATVMAALRYTIRTLILEGHDPGTVLERCAQQARDSLRPRFATALVGIGDVRRKELTIANAGHLNPLMVDGDRCEYLPTKVGPPLGVEGGSYDAVTIPVTPGCTFLAFTDGLVERRGEHLDRGMARLATAACEGPSDLDAMLTTIISQLTNDDVEDDVAILALRFQ